MATQYLHNRAYQAVSLTHFFIDILNNSRSLLVALLAVTLGLTNAQVGIALLLYNVGSALFQPIFGIWTDRAGSRWFVVGGMAWTIVLYTLAAVVGGWVALVAITLAGFGSGAFHPAGTKVASESSLVARTQATGIFFAAGQTGLFVGPILAGLLVDFGGQAGYLLLPLAATTALISSWRWVVNEPSVVHLDPKQDARSVTNSKAAEFIAQARPPLRLVMPLLVIILTSSTVGITIMNFAPKLFAEQGYGAAYVGATAGLYMLGSAVGGIVGGRLGDRVGRRPPIVIGMLAAILPIVLYVTAGDLARLLLLLVAGFFAGMPHSVLVITSQSLLPGRRAFASGLTLGIMFFGGAVGSYLVGLSADRIGLAEALQWLAVLPLIAAATAFLLPNAELTG